MTKIIKFPKSPVGPTEEEAIRLVPKMNKGAVVAVCPHCGKKYVLKPHELKTCLSPTCYVRAVFEAIEKGKPGHEEET